MNFHAASSVQQYCPFEVVLYGKSAGNPFTDYFLRGTFTHEKETINIHGFYDGDSCYRVRFMPS